MSNVSPLKARSMAALLLLTSLSLLAGEPAWNQKLPLHILYVGHPEAERTSDFVSFLKEHFQEVDTADLGQFQPKQKLNADVVVVDYDGDGFKAPRFSIPTGYSKPTVTIGVVGGLICSQSGLKTGYM
jgi:hypothetical protein